MGKEEILSGMIMELRRGVVVLGVLSQLKKAKYGYHLVRELTENGIPVEANTLYPLLRRLEGQGLLHSTWETGGAKPRKYYATTALGDEVYAVLKRNWLSLAESMNTILGEDDHEK